MNFAAIDDEHADDSPSGSADAYTALIGLARKSRLNLLLDRGGTGADGLLQAARQRGGDEIALLFDEWDGAPLAMLQQRLDEAVNAADPEAAPYFGDLPGALAHWQHEQGLRFFLIFHAFERHLQRDPDLADVAEFDRALIRLASDPMLDLNLLLCVAEEAAPALDRLRPFLPDLGQEYLRMPELLGAAPRREESATTHPPTNESDIAPADFPYREEVEAGMPTDVGAAAPEEDRHTDDSEDSRSARRRRRDFSSLLETLNAAPLARAMPEEVATARTATAVEAVQPAREAQPGRYYPWYEARLRRRRMATLRLATNGLLTTTVLCFVLLIIATLA